MARLQRPLATTVAAVAALAAGLGFAAAAGTVGGRELDAISLSTRVAAAGVGAAIGLVIGAAIVMVARRTTGPMHVALSGGTRGRAGALVLTFVLIGGLTAVDAVSESSTSSSPSSPVVDVDPAPASGSGSGERVPPEAEDRRSERFEFDTTATIVLIGGLIMLLFAVAFFARRTETRATGREGVYLRSDLELDPPTDDDPDDEALAEALRASRNRLTGEGTPADRIRAAYATMLDRFAEIGLGRRSSETPGTYVARCLQSRSLPAHAVTDLLHLFELARFSRVPLDEEHVVAATRALDDIVGHLAGVDV
jgi:hypothetical protein